MSEDIEARLITLERELTELRDREAIREVIHRYCQAVDRCDLEMLKSCYHPDSYDDHGFFAGNGHEFAEYVIPVLAEVDSSIHAITNTRFEFDGDRAACSSQWSVVHRLAHEAGFTDYWHNGRYLDVFEKRGGQWKILHRVIASDMDRWIDTLNLRSMMEGENSPVSGCRGDADPGYLGFDIERLRPERTAVEDLWGPFHLLSNSRRGAQ